jgi:hypothetical protein
MQKRAATVAEILFAGLALAACASAPVIEAPEAPSDYRKIVLEKLPGLLPPSVNRGVVEISPLRPAAQNAPAPWIACLLIDAQGKEPKHYALFLNDHDVVDSRLAVVIDKCESAPYAPLTPAKSKRRRR